MYSSHTGEYSLEDIRAIRKELDTSIFEHQQFALVLLHSDVILLIVGAIINIGINTSETIAFACVEFGRILAIPILAYLSIKRTNQFGLMSISCVNMCLGMLDIGFATYVIIMDDNTTSDNLMNTEYILRITPLWYRRLCLILGLPIIIRGLLLISQGLQLYIIRRKVGSITHLQAHERAKLTYAYNALTDKEDEANFIPVDLSHVSQNSSTLISRETSFHSKLSSARTRKKRQSSSSDWKIPIEQHDSFDDSSSS